MVNAEVVDPYSGWIVYGGHYMSELTLIERYMALNVARSNSPCRLRAESLQSHRQQFCYSTQERGLRTTIRRRGLRDCCSSHDGAARSGKACGLGDSDGGRNNDSLDGCDRRGGQAEA